MALPESIDFDFDFKEDPAPTKQKPSFGAAKKGPGRPSTKNVQKKELTDQLTFFFEMVAFPIQMRDPHCGDVIRENARNMAEAWSEQALNSPRLLKWFESLTAPTGWMNIGMATFPVAQAIFAHHVAPMFAPAQDIPEFLDVNGVPA